MPDNADGRGCSEEMAVGDSNTWQQSKLVLGQFVISRQLGS